jgi:hypothetical protein
MKLENDINAFIKQAIRNVQERQNIATAIFKDSDVGIQTQLRNTFAYGIGMFLSRRDDDTPIDAAGTQTRGWVMRGWRPRARH